MFFPRNPRPLKSFIKRNGTYMFELTNDTMTNLSKILEYVPEEFRALPDQTPAMDFNRGDSGWPQDDITALLKAQSDIELERISQRLVERKATTSNKDLSDEQILADIIPRYVNDNASLLKYIYDHHEVSVPESASITENVDVDTQASADSE